MIKYNFRILNHQQPNFDGERAQEKIKNDDDENNEFCQQYLLGINIYTSIDDWREWDKHN